MKLKILRATKAHVNGKMKTLEAGKTVDVDEDDAKLLIQMGKAEVPGGKKAKAEADSDAES